MSIIRKSKQMTEPRSKAERRKNFDPRKWASKFLKDGGNLPTQQIIGEIDEQAVAARARRNLATNQSRKEMGIEIDEGLEPVACDKCGILTVKLKMIPMDRGQGLKIFYHCESCVLGKNNANQQSSTTESISKES